MNFCQFCGINVDYGFICADCKSIPCPKDNLCEACKKFVAERIACRLIIGGDALSEKRNSKGGSSDVTALVACFRNEPSGDRRVSRVN